MHRRVSPPTTSATGRAILISAMQKRIPAAARESALTSRPPSAYSPKRAMAMPCHTDGAFHAHHRSVFCHVAYPITATC